MLLCVCGFLVNSKTMPFHGKNSGFLFNSKTCPSWKSYGFCLIPQYMPFMESFWFSLILKHALHGREDTNKHACRPFNVLNKKTIQFSPLLGFPVWHESRCEAPCVCDLQHHPFHAHTMVRGFYHFYFYFCKFLFICYCWSFLLPLWQCNV